MTLKTFNLDEEVYKEFSKHCKENGISMSKKVENFIREEIKNLKLSPKKAESASEKKDEHPFLKYC